MELSSGNGGWSSSEMVVPVKQGQSSSSNGTSTHQWTTTNTPEWSVELERLWRGRGRGQGCRRARDGDGGQRPARPGCGFLRWCGGVLSVCAERNELGGALFIGEAEAGIESSPELSGVSPGDEWRQ